MQINRTANALMARSCQGIQKASSVFCVNVAKDTGEANSQAVSDRADENGLDEDHSQKDGAIGPHRFERAEVFQVVEGEVVERLAGDDGADEKAQGDGDAEVDGDAGVGHEVVDGFPDELRPGERAQSRGRR